MRSGDNWNVTWGPLTEGLVPWPMVIQLLKNIDYDGILCFHAEYSQHDRTAELVSSDFDYIKSLLNGKDI